MRRMLPAARLNRVTYHGDRNVVDQTEIGAPHISVLIRVDP
jgi:hypothetical protein